MYVLDPRIFVYMTYLKLLYDLSDFNDAKFINIRKGLKDRQYGGGIMADVD